MNEKIIIAGSGGQGVMLLGKVLATSVMKESRSVTYFPSYGAEVRGGTAYCMVIVSDDEITSPYIGEADTLIIMNQPSLDRFKGRLKAKGLLILNSSLACAGLLENIKLLAHPFTDIAVNLGNVKIANMAALGVYISQKHIVKPETVFSVMEEMAGQGKEELVKINKLALEEGLRLK